MPVQKISVITNGVDTEFFKPSVECLEVRSELGLQDKFVVSFIGTLGNAHGLTTILDAARRLLNERADVMFLVVGEGAEKESIEAQARQSGLKNVLFVGQQPRARIPLLIGASDACLVPLKKSEIFKTVIPTKCWNICPVRGLSFWVSRGRRKN